MMEKERSVTHVETLAGVLLSSSRTRMMTRAICVLDRSRMSLLACCADSISEAQITKFSTLVRTLIFWLVRTLSAAIRQRKESSSSARSMFTRLPAQGKRGPVLSVFAIAIPYALPHHERQGQHRAMPLVTLQ